MWLLKTEIPKSTCIHVNYTLNFNYFQFISSQPAYKFSIKSELFSIFVQTPIFKARTFLRTRSHDGSAHTFRSGHRFLEVPQKKGYFLYFTKGGLKSDPLKFNLKSLNLPWWLIDPNICFTFTDSQSNVNVFSWGKILNY